MRLYLVLAAAALCVGAAPATPAKGVSASKLSVHFIGRYTAGGRAIVRAGPRVIKILDLGDDMRQAMREYKRLYPHGLVVLRIYTPVRYSEKDVPEEKARDFWYGVLWPPISRLPVAERRMISYLEGPNEGDTTPTWQTMETVRWFTRFWLELARLMHEHGFRPCVGSIPVGNPPGTPAEVESKFLEFAKVLRLVKPWGGAWSYHAYTIEYTQDAEREQWYSLRYRRLQETLRRGAPDVAGMPVILTEGGVDQSGNPNESGWAARGTAERYENWLRWFDGELQKDPYVIGVTLFELGNPEGWRSFDLEPISGWLATYLRDRHRWFQR